MTRRTELFDAIRPFAPERRFLDSHIQVIDALADSFGLDRVQNAPNIPLTIKGASELIEHEAIVQEAYKDSVGVWTWSVGLTMPSGVNVMVYKDNPASIETCLRAYIQRLRAVYIPDVLSAFGSRTLTEAQFTAALSFHYNTGAIKKTDWVGLWLSGKTAEARKFLTSHYLNGGTLQSRRNAEAALFFDGVWSGDGKATIYPVNKPSYTPAWSKAKRVDIMSDLAKVMVA